MIRRFLTASAFLILVGLLVVSCSRKPDEPSFDNPFDPNGSNPGTGYALTAAFKGDAVSITLIDRESVVEYRLYHSDVSGDFATMTEVDADSFTIKSSGGVATITTHKFSAQSTNWYRVRGRATTVVDGIEILVELQESLPVSLDLEAIARLSSSKTSTRDITISFLTGSATQVEVSNDVSFGNSTTFSVTPGTWTDIAWQLPLSAAKQSRSEELTVYWVPVEGSPVGAAQSLVVTRSIAPAFLFRRGTRALPTPALVDSVMVVSITAAEGIDGFVEGVIDLLDGTGAVVETFGPITSLDDSIIVSLDAGDTSQRRFSGYVRTDFADSVRFTEDKKSPPLAIENANVEVVGSSTVASQDLTLAITADGAGYYALSENPDFLGAAWTRWPGGIALSATDTILFSISPTLGTHRIYAAFSNPFLASPALASTEVELVLPPAQK